MEFSLLQICDFWNRFFTSFVTFFACFHLFFYSQFSCVGPLGKSLKFCKVLCLREPKVLFFFKKNLSLLIIKAIFFLLRFPLHIKISSCMCKRKFPDSFSRFHAYLRLDFGKWKSALIAKCNSRLHVWARHALCKIPLLLILINNTFTFWVEQYRYHLYCVQCTDVVSQSVNFINVV